MSEARTPFSSPTAASADATATPPLPADPFAAPAATTPASVRWAFALVIGFLAAAILYDAGMGINWPILVAIGAAGILVTAHARHGRAGLPSIAAAYWAIILATGVAITASGGAIFLLVVSSLFFLAVAMAAAGHTSLSALRPRLAILAPFAAVAGSFVAFLHEIADSRGLKHASRRNVVFRSILFTLPVVLVLVALLGDADPLFAAMRSAMEHLVPLDEPGRIAFFFFALAASLGALGSVSRANIDIADTHPFAGMEIGQVESRTLVTGIAGVMWLFVASAAYSMTQNPAARAGSGTTYAEYAHQGFAELNIAAILVIGIILGTRRTWKRDDSMLWRTAMLAIAGVGAMLVIAFMRLVAYEQAYGFTGDRIQAQQLMIVLASALVLLAFEMAQRAPSQRFAYRAMTAALTIAMAGIYYNTDAWIMRRNLELYQTSGKLDVDYFIYSLSADATPEILASLPKLHAPEREKTVNALCYRFVNKETRDARWFTWNLRATRAQAAREKWFADARPTCPPPHPDH